MFLACLISFRSKFRDVSKELIAAAVEMDFYFAVKLITYFGSDTLVRLYLSEAHKKHWAYEILQHYIYSTTLIFSILINFLNLRQQKKLRRINQ